MKKIYLTPQIEVEKVETSGMLAVSGFDEVLDETGGDGPDALSREFDETDDYDEDEEF